MKNKFVQVILVIVLGGALLLPVNQKAQEML